LTHKLEIKNLFITKILSTKEEFETKSLI